MSTITTDTIAPTADIAAVPAGNYWLLFSCLVESTDALVQSLTVGQVNALCGQYSAIRDEAWREEGDELDVIAGATVTVVKALRDVGCSSLVRELRSESLAAVARVSCPGSGSLVGVAHAVVWRGLALAGPVVGADEEACAILAGPWERVVGPVLSDA